MESTGRPIIGQMIVDGGTDEEKNGKVKMILESNSDSDFGQCQSKVSFYTRCNFYHNPAAFVKNGGLVN